jgi:hypothetical protein
LYIWRFVWIQWMNSMKRSFRMKKFFG